MKGGYKIIDLKGAPIKVSTATKAVIPGVYDAIESTTKPILLEGLVVNDTTNKEFIPAFITPSVDSGNYVFSVYDYNFVVTDDDEVYWVAQE